MIHEILRVGMLQCNCSIFGDEQTREAIVIDPGDNIPEIFAIVKRHELSVKAIVITHAHIDHIGGAHKLRAATGAPVYMNQNDALLREMLRSIHDKLLPLPDETIVIPGHGESTTIGREKQFNYFLQRLSRS